MVTGKVGILGCGALGTALCASWLQETRLRGAINLLACHRRKEVCEELRSRFGIPVLRSARQLVTEADIVVLAVRPEQIGQVAQDVAGVLQPRHVLISVVAGIGDEPFQQCRPAAPRVVHAIPSSLVFFPSGLQYATHVLRQTETSDAYACQVAEELFTLIGQVVWVNIGTLAHDQLAVLASSTPALWAEILIELSTAFSNRGIAYREVENTLLRNAIATFDAISKGMEPTEVVERIATAGGVTEAAIRECRAATPEIFRRAVDAAIARCSELRKTV